MRIATWNVNSVTARLPRLLDWLEQTGPDVLCLQETKTSVEAFPVEAVRALGGEAHRGEIVQRALGDGADRDLRVVPGAEG